MRKLCFLVLVSLFLLLPVRAQEWLQSESEGGQYTIYYVTEYEKDLEFVHKWLDHAEELMADKYGIKNHGISLKVYLHPATSRYASRGLATLLCCTSDKKGTIHYMTPSSPDYGTGTLGGLQLRPDDYHAKTLIHEYISVGHERVTERKGGGFRYYSAPSWFVQGLEEYDGMFHSTESNRTTGYDKLIRYADRSLQGQFCSFGSFSSYFGGTFMQRFLVERFGPGIHAELLRSNQPTFQLAFEEVLSRHDTTPDGAFEDFQPWFDAKVDGGLMPSRN